MRIEARRLIFALTKIDASYLVNVNNKELSLSEAEYCFMYALDDGLPHSQKEISSEWLIPKTTLNAIAKRWEKAGLLTLEPIPGKRREMRIALTEAGQKYAREILSFIYEAEEKALRQTLKRYSTEFIDALEYFGSRLKEAFEEAKEAFDELK
ncbi:MAG: hypothetical protein IJE97_05710 [Thermoguttaceae bacterium]|nr:hypothetical protein [Thermoguttaceae bacterium]MBQ6828906.1 hypothetical protein [Thermoguttaceae bacterium]MBQ7110634.1 hypothetical protein [Thermoguttaceae bacterium]